MAPLKPWALVTPASRGIGLALSRHLLRTTRLPVVATARSDLSGVQARILDGLDGVSKDRLQVLKVDVTDESTISSAAEELAERYPQKEAYLHLGMLLPGILLQPEKSPAQISADDALETFRVNTLGPMLLAKHLSGFLPKQATTLAEVSDMQQDGNDAAKLSAHATLALMSARVGSISDNKLGGWYAYRTSKAAVNQLVKSLDNWLAIRSKGKAVVVGLHPGTVRSGLSEGMRGSVPEDRVLEPEDSAQRLINILGELDAEKGRGRCWDAWGEEVPP